MGNDLLWSPSLGAAGTLRESEASRGPGRGQSPVMETE